MEMWALLLLGSVATVSCQYPVNAPIGLQPIPFRGQEYYPIVPAAPQVSYVTPAAVANCILKPATNSRVSGQIEFYQSPNSNSVEIRANVYNLSPGPHGFHLHQEGNTGNDCKAAGPHFNPYNHTHGGPHDQVRHAGDFGNIIADAHGQVLNYQIEDSHISLIPGNIGYAVGRAIVVHAGEDDLGRGGNEESLKTGNAGARLACCVVEAVSYR